MAMKKKYLYLYSLLLSVEISLNFFAHNNSSELPSIEFKELSDEYTHPLKNTKESLFFVTTLPKCGTHLLLKAIRLLNAKKQVFIGKSNAKQIVDSIINNPSILFHGHWGYTIENVSLVELYGMKGIFIYRDPRDRVISHAYWVDTRPPGEAPHLKKLNFHDRITYLIKTTNQYYASYMPWRKHPQFYSCRFEDLVGPMGGGILENQLKEIKNLAKYMDISLTDENSIKIAAHLFGNKQLTKHTFRKGQIGSWKSHFTEEQKKLFKELAGQLLIDLGYEKDLSW